MHYLTLWKKFQAKHQSRDPGIEAGIAHYPNSLLTAGAGVIGGGWLVGTIGIAIKFALNEYGKEK